MIRNYGCFFESLREQNFKVITFFYIVVSIEILEVICKNNLQLLYHKEIQSNSQRT